MTRVSVESFCMLISNAFDFTLSSSTPHFSTSSFFPNYSLLCVLILPLPMSHAGNPHRYQHNPVRIPPPALFGAPPLPNCFDAAAPLNLETLERRWKAFGTSELPFSKDQKIQKNHWFWIWKDKTWEELVRGLTRLNERKTVNSYIQTFCDYLRRLGGYVRGGQIADRNCFFKEFVSARVLSPVPLNVAETHSSTWHYPGSRLSRGPGAAWQRDRRLRDPDDASFVQNSTKYCTCLPAVLLLAFANDSECSVTSRHRSALS